MSRFSRPGLCALGFLCLVGCSKPTAPKDAAEEQAALDLKLFGLGYRNYYETHQRPPRNSDELNTVISSDRPIEFDRYHIIWGVDLSPALPARTVLAYDVAVPQKGGMVLFHTGEVERVTAEEFEQLSRAAPAKPLAERSADVTLTPAEYLAEFTKLNLAMGPRYQGKVVELKGTVKGLGALSGRPELLVIDPGKEHEYVRCLMAGDEEFWARISKGQQVNVKGLVRDPQGSPMLINCGIASAGPATGVTTTAEDLAKEFAADGEQAAAKYKGKSLVLTGEVVSVTAWGTSRGVKLKGTADRPVECVFHSNESSQERDKRFAPGAKIKLYAEYDNNGTRLMNCELISR